MKDLLKVWENYIDWGVYESIMYNYPNIDYTPHFIFCTDHSHPFRTLIEIFKRKWDEHGFQPLILTILFMNRLNLITKEKQKLAYKGQLKGTSILDEEFWNNCEGSINDDLESFLRNLQIKKDTETDIKEEFIESFLLPKLTKEDLKLVAQKDKDHFDTYRFSMPDVDEEEMKNSDSRDKFVRCWCRRETYFLTLDKNNISFGDGTSESELLNSSSDNSVDSLE